MKTKNNLLIFCVSLCISISAQNNQQQLQTLQLNVDSLGNIKVIALDKLKSTTQNSYNIEPQNIVSSQRISKTKKDETYTRQESNRANLVSKTQSCSITNVTNKIILPTTGNDMRYTKLNMVNDNGLSLSKFNETNATMEKLPGENKTNFQTSNDPKGSPNLYVYTGVGSNNSFNFDGTTHILDITASVVNGGTATAYLFRIGFYLSTDIIFQTTDAFVSGYYFISLTNGYYANAQVSADLDDLGLASGTYYIYMVCDDNNLVTESNETDNSRYFLNPITYTKPAGPNLSNYFGAGSNTSYNYNNETKLLNLNASIINNGTESAYNFHVGFYLSNDIVFDASDMLVDGEAFTSLTDGYYSNIAKSTDLNNKGLTSGTYYIFIAIDDKFQVTETNENDNLNYFIEPLTYTEPITVNLFIYTGEGSNNSYTYNDATKLLNVSASIANGGNSVADTFLVAFCLSLNEVLDTNDICVGLDTINPLESGYFADAKTMVDLGKLELASGTYYVFIVCDLTNKVTETNETDNVDHFIVPIIFSEPIKTNLFIYTGEGSKNAYEFEASSNVLQLYTSIGNVGNTSANNFRVGFYLSDDIAIDNSDKLINSVSISSIEYNHYKNIEPSADLDNLNLTAGAYFIIIYCDDLLQIAETDETDNGVYFNESISFTPAEVVNICIYKGKEAQNTFSYDVSTHELQVSASIENVGNTTAKNFRIGLYLSIDATIKNSDTYLDDITITSLENGKFKTIEFALDLDNLTITSGIYHLGIVCDDLNKIDETMETDNGYCFNNTIEFSTTSVIEKTQSVDFIVYPNPTADIVTIQPNENINTESVITILGFNGIELEKHLIPIVSKENALKIDLSNYKSGIYFIQISSSNISTIRKIIKL